MSDPLYIHNLSLGFTVFGHEIRWYGVLFAATFLVGYYFLRRAFLRFGYDETKAQNYYFFGLVGVLVGARLVHVFFYDLDDFLARPSMVIEIWKGGLASHGGITGVIIACLLFWRIYKVKLLEILDIVAIPLAVAAVLVRLGNFINGEIVGRPTDLPWAMVFPSYDMVPRHPTQLYEAAYGFIVFLHLYFLDNWRWKHVSTRGKMTGILFFTGAIHWPAWRFLTEYVKEYQTLSPDFPLTMGQLLTIPFILGGIIGTVWILRHPEVPETPPPKPAVAAPNPVVTAPKPAKPALGSKTKRRKGKKRRS